MLKLFCWGLVPLSLIILVLLYQIFFNLLLCPIFFLLVFIVGTFFYKNRIEWWYSTLFFSLLFFFGFFYYAIVTPHSWTGYIQNFSLIPLHYRALFFLVFWMVATVFFILGLVVRKKVWIPFFKLSSKLIGVIIFLNICLDVYYIVQLIHISDSPRIAKIFIKTRYGIKKEIIPLINQGVDIHDSEISTTVNSKYSIQFNSDIFRHEFFSIPDKHLIFTMKHWVMNTGEIYWVLGKTPNDSDYILYWHAYDKDDLTKVYVTNLKTKKTTLLTKGKWLNDLTFS